MYTESIPVSVFVKQTFEHKEIKAISDQWRVETAQLMAIITANLTELGIYDVSPDLAKNMKTILLEFLVNSPEIIKIVHEAERRERILARTKKSLSD